MDLIEKGLRHLNFILCALCIIAGVGDLGIVVKYGRWSHLADGLLLLATGVLLFFNACKIGKEGKHE